MQLVTQSAMPSPIELFEAREALPAAIRLRTDPAFARVRPGVYATRAEWGRLKPWQRYLARVHAYALINPDAIFCHESAAALLGLPVIGEPRDIHVFDPDRTRSARFGDVAVHTSQDAREFVSLGALRVTDAAHTALDLARVLPPAFGLAVVDAALGPRGGNLAPASLVELASAQSATHGRVKLRWLWQHANGQSESVGESVSRAVIAWLGFAEPELQLEIQSEGYLDRVDFAWRRARVIGESDGYGKYLAEDPDETRARLIAEKQREDRLRRVMPGFARWDWASTMQATPLGDKLHAAGVPLVRSPTRLMLATLNRHPRSFDGREPRP